MFARSHKVIQAHAATAACVSACLQQCTLNVRVHSTAGRTAAQRDAAISVESGPMCVVDPDRECSGMRVASCAQAAFELHTTSAAGSHTWRLHRGEHVGSMSATSISEAARPVAAPMASRKSIACTAASRAARSGQLLMVPATRHSSGAGVLYLSRRQDELRAPRYLITARSQHRSVPCRSLAPWSGGLCA